MKYISVMAVSLAKSEHELAARVVPGKFSSFKKRDLFPGVPASRAMEARRLRTVPEAACDALSGSANSAQTSTW